MPKLNIVVPHELSSNEAKWRIKALLGEVKKQFADKITNLREQWNGNTATFSFSVVGLSVSGVLMVKGSEVELSGNLPFAVAFFKRKIESTSRERAESLLA